jgi:Protein of unknown function (DUF3095)
VACRKRPAPQSANIGAMDSPSPTRDFYESLPVFRDFTQVADETCFRPLPGDWIIGVADVQQSTRAIRENRYKAVNMAGAAVIASIANALKGRDFPFVFGGDGASFAVPPEDGRRRRPGSRKTSISVCGSEWLRSPTFARKAATFASPVTCHRRM